MECVYCGEEIHDGEQVAITEVDESHDSDNSCGREELVHTACCSHTDGAFVFSAANPPTLRAWGYR